MYKRLVSAMSIMSDKNKVTNTLFLTLISNGVIKEKIF